MAMVMLLLRVIINSFSIWVASLIVDGIQLSGSIWEILLLGVVFGLINALIKPILTLIGAPWIVLTLGLLTLLINTVLLLFTEWLMRLLDVDVLTIDSFWAALLASIVISAVSWALNLLLE